MQFSEMRKKYFRKADMERSREIVHELYELFIQEIENIDDEELEKLEASIVSISLESSSSSLMIDVEDSDMVYLEEPIESSSKRGDLLDEFCKLNRIGLYQLILEAIMVSDDGVYFYFAEYDEDDCLRDCTDKSLERLRKIFDDPTNVVVEELEVAVKYSYFNK